MSYFTLRIIIILMEPIKNLYQTPTAPAGLSLAGVRVIIADHALGLPVLRALSLCTCCRHYPGAATRCLRSLTLPYQPSPKTRSGRSDRQ